MNFDCSSALCIQKQQPNGRKRKTKFLKEIVVPKFVNSANFIKKRTYNFIEPYRSILSYTLCTVGKRKLPLCSMVPQLYFGLLLHLLPPTIPIPCRRSVNQFLTSKRFAASCLLSCQRVHCLLLFLLPIICSFMAFLGICMSLIRSRCLAHPRRCKMI